MSEQGPPQGDPRGAPTEEELRAYAEQLRQVRVEDVIAQTLGPLLNLGTLRAGLMPGSEGEVDLGQLRKAIEAARALLPLVEAELGPEAPAVRGAVSNLQMAYAQLVNQAGGAPPEAGAGEAPPTGPGAGAPGQAPPGQAPPGQAPPGQAPQQAPEEDPIKPGEPGPAQRSGRLWVPGQ
jgi:hypothetical protein